MRPVPRTADAAAKAAEIHSLARSGYRLLADREHADQQAIVDDLACF
jgi:hypothetical protein